jgi:hypothetical protein
VEDAWRLKKAGVEIMKVVVNADRSEKWWEAVNGLSG